MNIFRKEMNLYALYTMEQIENYAEKEQYEIEEIGTEEIYGKWFILLEHKYNDSTLTFILSACNNNGEYFYKLIFIN